MNYFGNDFNMIPLIFIKIFRQGLLRIFMKKRFKEKIVQISVFDTLQIIRFNPYFLGNLKTGLY